MEAEDFLQKYELKNTVMRKKVVSIFMMHNQALAHKDIEHHLDGDFDRVTLYRTLSTFEEKGLVHKVVDGSTAVKYALCTHTCEHGHHQDNHIHFKCNRCNRTICVDDVEIPEIELPKGFSVKGLSFLAEGICDDCNQ